jgi:hypothetical protein
VSGLTQFSDELVSQSKYSDGVDVDGPAEVEDGDVPSVGVPDGVPELLALPDTALELSDATLDEAPVDGPIMPLSLTVIEEKLAIDAVVGDAPVDGPVIPLLSLTVIEEKLAVAEAPVDDPVMPLVPLADIEPKLTVSRWEISGGA